MWVNAYHDRGRSRNYWDGALRQDTVAIQARQISHHISKGCEIPGLSLSQLINEGAGGKGRFEARLTPTVKACPACGLSYPADASSCFVDRTELVEVADPRVGTIIAGRYLLESVIGMGGMATVYRARHRLVERPCAVKVMSRAFATNEVVRERFRREAHSAQKLAHPNIIEIFDQGDTDDGSLYLVMELLEGESLADVLDHGAVSLERALSILIQMSRALARAHDLEVIHRDLKPENIFLTKDSENNERVVLLDFGIARSMQDARLTGAGELFGTPQYMAPERITSIDAGPSADLYALGMIAFEILTGRLPFRAKNAPDWFMQHVRVAPISLRTVDPIFPEALDRVVSELLEKDPTDRPADAHHLNRVLCTLCQELGIPVPPELSIAHESSGRAATLPPANLDAWAHRLQVFERMLRQAYPNGGPDDLQGLLQRLRQSVAQVAELRSQCVALERQLEDIEVRARDGRQRFGHAVDALGIDASRARSQLKDTGFVLSEQEKIGAEQRQRVLELHSQVIHWEGRSAFMEPLAPLVAAYRELANAVERWGIVHRKWVELVERQQQARSDVTDIEFQIQALRNALVTYEQGIEGERTECQQRLGEMGKRADQLEAELVRTATRFCAPLHRKPELRVLFRELEVETNTWPSPPLSLVP